MELASLIVSSTLVIQLTYAPSKAPSFEESSIGISSDQRKRNFALIAVFSVVGVSIVFFIAVYFRNILSHKRTAEIKEWEDFDLQTEFGFVPNDYSAVSSASCDSRYRVHESSDYTFSHESHKVKDDVYIDL